MEKKSFCFLLLFLTISFFGQSNSETYPKSVRFSDNGNGTYSNPIINSDYSDPDAIRVGNKFYMTASSFNCIPGLPILESEDLVNWKIISYALNKLSPEEVYDLPQHGKGVWAPCIRYHKNEFYIYYPDPDFGIYMIKSKKPEGPWSKPIIVKSGKGLIDPSPLWDDDGKTYLVYAFAGSRAGIKNMLVISTMNTEGTLANNDEVLILDGHKDEPTIEGPKIYKRNNFYYIFAPAGGVATGWQTVLRSKNIYGPYEKRKVLDQGKTEINGPHQGAWVQTKNEEDWFLHFQDKDVYGRVVHLQPMKWSNDWPVIGIDDDGDGIGQPVITYKKPNIGNKKVALISPPDSDEFNEPKLGLQWQWHANPQINWGFPSALGYFTLNCIPKSKGAVNLIDIPNLLLQKFPDDNFTATAKLQFDTHFDGEEAGLVIMGLDYSYLKIKKSNGSISLSQMICMNANKKEAEKETEKIELKNTLIYLQVKVVSGGICTFSYSEDGTNFKNIGKPFTAKEGRWTGAKLGFVALREDFTNDAGNLKMDWIRFNKIQ